MQMLTKEQIQRLLDIFDELLSEAPLDYIGTAISNEEADQTEYYFNCVCEDFRDEIRKLCDDTK